MLELTKREFTVRSEHKSWANCMFHAKHTKHKDVWEITCVADNPTFGQLPCGFLWYNHEIQHCHYKLVPSLHNAEKDTVMGEARLCICQLSILIEDAYKA